MIGLIENVFFIQVATLTVLVCYVVAHTIPWVTTD
jgi:hypothetical protein